MGIIDKAAQLFVGGVPAELSKSAKNRIAGFKLDEKLASEKAKKKAAPKNKTKKKRKSDTTFNRASDAASIDRMVRGQTTDDNQ